MGLFTRLFRGVKYDIKNIHIRYEDDFYSAEKPFSFGLTIKDIKLDTDVQQEKAEQKENSSTIVKLQEIRGLSIYWNTMSEMFVPTSVWDQSYELPYGIFELIEADIILQMMKDQFNQKVGMKNQFLVEPFSYQMQFAIRNSYNMQKDAYKYKVAIGIEKVRINMNPSVIANIISFHEYIEGQSYQEDLKRYRPLIRLQTMIELRERLPGKKLPKRLEDIRRALVRDWFRLVLWYVRLRKAARAVKFTYRRYQDITVKAFSGGNDVDGEAGADKAYFPQSLLEVETRFQASKGKPVDLNSTSGL